ncbi:hypothetical protein T03_16772 [Trichinella britovi]|uniref:Uncharacterized protein n=1 Tax=Trichinella britovi TaxID=45882 RepID=A0A0V1DEH2_TRIBR|nr:hypothetical protein T03_16772 [Trichinella britovi]
MTEENSLKQLETTVVYMFVKILSSSIDYLINGLAETVETEFSFIVSYRAPVTGDAEVQSSFLWCLKSSFMRV